MTTDAAQKSTLLLEPMDIKTEKCDSVLEEIILCDSSDEDNAELMKTLFENNKNTEHRARFASVFGSKNSEKYALLRGLLPPESDKSYSWVVNLPVVKRCCIEHCYFARNRSRLYRYHLRNLPAASANTLQFENENSSEQQTIDLGCLAPQEVKSASLTESVDKNNVNVRKKRNSVSSSSNSSSSSSRSSSSSSSRSNSSSGSAEDSPADDSYDQDYCPEDNYSGTECETASVRSVGSCDSVKDLWKSNVINSSYNNFKNVFAYRRKSFPRRWLEITSYPAPHNIPNNFVSVHDLLAKIRKMQKLVKAKCGGEPGKTAKIPPPRLKKMISRGKGEDFLKMSEYLFPMPNLTKMVNGARNWNVEYMDDEVQSLGLDDLLLKASELNAENFTKALGRKLEPAKSNFNSKDSSEIVFTFPKSKRNDAEQVADDEGDAAKHQNLKTIKIDISKPFFESDKTSEAETAPVASKLPEEDSPKRPGIKVKTVENINEEFKDSLGLKGFQDGTDKKIPPKDAGELEKGEEKAGEGSRPFIMTIIQSKAEKQRPAILRNSSYFKRKANPQDHTKAKEKAGEATNEAEPSGNSAEGEKPEDSSEQPPKQEKTGFGGMNQSKNESFGRGGSYGRGFGSYPKVVDELEGEAGKPEDGVSENRFTVKKRNIPFILNHNRKTRQAETSIKAQAPSKLVKINEGTEKVVPSEKTFRVTSIEQKLGPKETNRKFIKVVPYEHVGKPGKKSEPAKAAEQKLSDEEGESPQKDGKSGHVISLSAFYTILKEILPDKWIMCLDKKYGLQIIRTHVDELLNPSILISVVIARCGKLTVNVRGRQLHKSHELFSNLCEMTTSENKLSLNYVLAIINKLRCLSVCFGCDDPSLKKYWCEDGFVEHHSEFQQVYRSHLCQLLVSLGKKRCYPCYRMNESFKKRYRRDKLEEKPREEPRKESLDEQDAEAPKSLQSKGVKRNLEDFLEESFSTMKQQIADEIEKNKKLGERENALKAQEEVLSFMGLARKESLDAPLRKSKRKKNSFYKLQQPVKKKIAQQELEFLEKYWADINTLFSTSLLFGAYSRTGRGRLREKCRMFHKLLSTWRNIVRSNPDWIGGEITLPDELADGDQFEKMDASALRAYIISSVKEVNRIKHKLRTKNSYFKVLYNKFVKRRMKRPKALCSQSKGNGSSANSTTNTPTPTDFSSDESSRDREKATDDEIRPAGDAVTTTSAPDGD